MDKENCCVARSSPASVPMDKPEKAAPKKKKLSAKWLFDAAMLSSPMDLNALCAAAPPFGSPPRPRVCPPPPPARAPAAG